MEKYNAVAQVVVDEEVLLSHADKFLEEFYTRHLTKDWYTRKEIMFKTGIKSHDWVRDNIDNHPYVVERGIKFNLGDSANSEPRYTKAIDEFLEKFGLLKKELIK